MPFPLVDNWVIKPVELSFIGWILGGLEAEVWTWYYIDRNMQIELLWYEQQLHKKQYRESHKPAYVYTSYTGQFSIVCLQSGMTVVWCWTYILLL